MEYCLKSYFTELCIKIDKFYHSYYYPTINVHTSICRNRIIIIFFYENNVNIPRYTKEMRAFCNNNLLFLLSSYLHL